MARTGLAVACDLRPFRLALLRDTFARVAAHGIAIVRADATQVAFRDAFDVVLLDAPCSGLGTVRREPEIRWRRQPSDLPAFAAVQDRMIASAATAVQPGGMLVYATCSSEPEENEHVVDRFLAARGEFSRMDPAAHPWRAHPPEAALDARGDLRTEPHRHGLEAFFAAVLRRRDGV
jgi:16S rRNA (cytosine967-C5)-methyltransferase